MQEHNTMCLVGIDVKDVKIYGLSTLYEGGLLIKLPTTPENCVVVQKALEVGS